MASTDKTLESKREKKFKDGALGQEAYSNLSDIDHVLQIPDMYVGSCGKDKFEDLVIDPSKLIMEMRITQLPEAMRKLFLEILNNMTDASFRYKISGREDIPPLKITMDKTRITAINGGFPIPVEIHKESKVYVPEMIFGMLRSSSNYDPNVIRMGCGRNGYGAKLTNIFSVYFSIEIGDNIRKKKYCQFWTGNMKIRNDPVITDYTGENYVKVEYDLDFARFGYKEYPAEAFWIYARYCADASMGCKIPVIFNEKLIDCSDITNYSKMYFPELVPIVNIQYPMVIPTNMNKKVQKMYPEIELLILDTPEKGTVISLVNGNMTRDGGVHVNEAYRALSEIILEKVNKEGIRLNISDVKNNVSIILNCRFKDPTYGSQTKHVLNSPKVQVNIENKNIPLIHSLKAIENLKNLLEFKNLKILKKSDGVKRAHINNKVGTDANLAGTKKSAECVLLIVEGHSAAGYANNVIKTIENGLDYYGVLPLKGKPLNLRKALEQCSKSGDYSRISDNAEYIELKKFLGLREESVDFDYNKPENMETLRYGKVYIMVDADVDGKHILGLLYDLFECQFPTLLKNGFLKFYRTPILRVRGGTGKNAINEKFYSQNSFNEWAEKNKNKNYNVDYFKGLGTSTDNDIKSDSKNPNIVNTVYDSLAGEKLKLAFDPNMSDDRKYWIENRNIIQGIENLKDMEISNFIDNEFIEYCVSNIERSIPRLVDGLKPSQRKILWTLLMKENGYNKNCAKVKVANLSGVTAAYTNYHNGETSLVGAIVNMAQDFVGSNNLPYLAKEGQFGTRNMGGKDAAQARYIYTLPMWWIPLVIKKVDLPLLQILNDEGQSVEPLSFIPIIPMVLVNGACGIGTGYSTFIPCYNPVDLCKWLKSRLLGKNITKLKPWYRGFDGKIEFKKVKCSIIKAEEDENNEILDIESKAMVTKGDFVITDKNDVTVTELPIGYWYNNYIGWLKTQITEGNIKNFRTKYVGEQMHFELSGVKILPSHESLNLVKNFSIRNMYLLDNNNKPKKYDSADEIIEEFYQFRLPYFQKRKDLIISDLNKEIEKFSVRAKFITLEINGTIKIRNTKKDECVRQMTLHNLPTELLSQISIGNFTLEEVNDLLAKIEKLKLELKIINETTPENMWINDLDEFLDELKKKH